MGKDREVETQEGKTFNTVSGGKVGWKSQENLPEHLGSTGVSWTHPGEVPAGLTRTQVKNGVRELAPKTRTDLLCQCAALTHPPFCV